MKRVSSSEMRSFVLSRGDIFSSYPPSCLSWGYRRETRQHLFPVTDSPSKNGSEVIWAPKQVNVSAFGTQSHSPLYEQDEIIRGTVLTGLEVCLWLQS